VEENYVEDGGRREWKEGANNQYEGPMASDTRGAAAQVQMVLAMRGGLDHYAMTPAMKEL
jgi:hypothetical protein